MKSLSSMKWWQKAIIANLVICIVLLFGVEASWFVLLYTIASAYLLKYIPTDKIEGYDDIA